MTNVVNRYSDSELEEFRALIEKKLTRAREQIMLLESQITEMTENSDGDYGLDMMDDSNTNNDVEMLNNLAIHQRKYIRELENALSRIRNKTYGICEVTGELIDKKRLLAVPTTTKSLAAKMGEAATAPPPPPADVAEDDEEEDIGKKERQPARTSERRIITKVIRKLPTKVEKPPVSEDEDDEIYTDDSWDSDEDSREISMDDLDNIADDDAGDSEEY